MKLPMREKYVDEAVGTYTIFGARADGTVDVNDGTSDIFCGLQEDVAKQVIEAHDAFRERLYEILCKK